MKSSIVLDIFKDRQLVIPIYLLKNYKEFKLDLTEFLLIMYLYNKGEKFLFNPNEICSVLSMDLTEVMNIIGSLTEKKLIKIDVLKNEKGYMEEVVLLDGFYEKVRMLIIDDTNKGNSNDIANSTIFEYIEKEFGRSLSSIEIEIIKAWLENNFSEEIIKEAVKEAVFNGVSNLKYIDKILYEWSKKGINTKEDVEANRKRKIAQLEKNKEIDSEIDLGIMDWDWFDDEE